MRRCERANSLEEKLKTLLKISNDLNEQRIKDGVVNFEACQKFTEIQTEIYLTKKKIGFSKQGASYLGSQIKNYTSKISDN